MDTHWCQANRKIISYTTRREKLFKNFIEINLVEDSAGNRLVGKVKTTQDFYLTLASLAGTSFGTRDDTLIFLDEIQQYPELLTLLKFLRKEGRFRYVASGSLLGITLKKSTSIPLGSIEIVRMYQLDFEEFLITNSINSTVIEYLRECLITERSPISSIHERLLDLFKKYLLVGGMPDAVHEFLESQNIVKIRDIQNAIHELYELDAGKYDEEHRLKIKRIYEMIPSNMENKKKRLFFNAIEGKKARASNFLEEIDYLTNSGISLEVQSNTDPTFPLIQSSRKNLLKLYLNDVGILTSVLYKNNINAILGDANSISLGSVYESTVAMQLASLGHSLFYYDNRHKGEVDFLIDDYNNLTVVPIEVKSGKDYTIHSALNSLLNNAHSRIRMGIVLSNSGEIKRDGKILYLLVYMAMLLKLSGEEPKKITL
ncbi:DUF4143 domain-containing protein [uncultured Parasutterella sp.]|uniref:ATP-binding protein n=1 Tax=uncultured Parasutterella sp. TaxID=1263098 RepID=UPI00338D84FF